jgi:hypothetical protein
MKMRRGDRRVSGISGFNVDGVYGLLTSDEKVRGRRNGMWEEKSRQRRQRKWRKLW